MARKPETVFRKRVLKDLKKLQNTEIRPVQQISIVGDPDYFLCVYGWFVSLELKDSDGKESAIQKYKRYRVKKTNGYAFVADPENWATIYSELELISGGEV